MCSHKGNGPVDSYFKKTKISIFHNKYSWKIICHRIRPVVERISHLFVTINRELNFHYVLNLFKKKSEKSKSVDRTILWNFSRECFVDSSYHLVRQSRSLWLSWPHVKFLWTYADRMLNFQRIYNNVRSHFHILWPNLFIFLGILVPKWLIIYF